MNHYDQRRIGAALSKYINTLDNLQRRREAMPKLRNINAIVEETGVVKEDILEIVNKHPKLGSIRELMAAGGVNVILSTYEEASIKKALVPEPTE